jgi:hydrogenase nickel incorporation protein HypB
VCDVCGCGDTRIVAVELHERLLADNDRKAEHNRDHLRAHGVVTINLMGSPGAGKTALLEATAQKLGGQAPGAVAAPRLAAITGDLETERDADRVRAAGIRAHAITTGSACHLDAEMVHRALHHDIALDTDYLFIENVGNLVCPAIYDLGQEANVVALSVTEGEDKPLKYPVMFRSADLVLLTKIDLLPALPDYDLGLLEAALARVMPSARMIAVSARSGEGMTEWIGWLQRLRDTQPQPTVRNAGTAHRRPSADSGPCECDRRQNLAAEKESMHVCSNRR